MAPMKKTDPEYIARGEQPKPQGLEHLTALSYLLDRAFRIPGTQWRFGIDALMGLVPGLGDVIGSLVGAYSLWIARQLGAPIAVQGRMVMNLAIDGIVGLVPFAGDLFDFAFKAHTRNQALLAKWLESPHQTRRSSAVVLVLGLLVMLGLLGLSVWLLISAAQWALGLLQG
jgi:hypothetical protein